MDILEAPNEPATTATEEQESEESSEGEMTDGNETMIDGLPREFADNLDALDLQGDLSYEQYDDEEYKYDDL